MRGSDVVEQFTRVARRHWPDRTLGTTCLPSPDSILIIECGRGIDGSCEFCLGTDCGHAPIDPDVEPGTTKTRGCRVPESTGAGREIRSSQRESLLCPLTLSLSW